MKRSGHYLFFLSSVLGSEAFLDPEQMHHGCAVLRMRKDDLIKGTDGKGWIYTCSLKSIENNIGRCEIVEKVFVPRGLPNISVYLGLPDYSSFERALENLVPLGVENFVPVVCQNCQKQWWEHGWKKHQHRLIRKMISAIKQAQLAWLPQLGEPLVLEKAITHSSGLKIVADPSGEPILSGIGIFCTAERISCFIGPPGGFSLQEKELFAKERVFFVSLVPQRLRTELAATVMVAQLLCLSGRKEFERDKKAAMAPRALQDYSTD